MYNTRLITTHPTSCTNEKKWGPRAEEGVSLTFTKQKRMLFGKQML